MLLDTSTLVWAADASPRLSATVRDALVSAQNELYVSVVSPWEIAIKQALGRDVRIIGDLGDFMGRARARGFRIVPVRLQHALQVQQLPPHHGDPFDRMLVAQAQVEDLVLVTNNRRIAAYDVQTLW